MKTINYIKVLSAVLLMFGYTDNNYSTAAQQKQVVTSNQNKTKKVVKSNANTVNKTSVVKNNANKTGTNTSTTKSPVATQTTSTAAVNQLNTQQAVTQAVTNTTNNAVQNTVTQAQPNTNAQTQLTSQSNVPNLLLNEIVQGQGTTVQQNIVQQNKIKNVFELKQDSIHLELKYIFDRIVSLMNSAFHMNKHDTQNTVLKNAISTFLGSDLQYNECNDTNAQNYGNAVKVLKAQLKQYVDGCDKLLQQDSKSTMSKIANYSRYNSQILNSLMAKINEFEQKLDSSITTLYPDFVDKINTIINQVPQQPVVQETKTIVNTLDSDIANTINSKIKSIETYMSKSFHGTTSKENNKEDMRVLNEFKEGISGWNEEQFNNNKKPLIEECDSFIKYYNDHYVNVVTPSKLSPKYYSYNKQSVTQLVTAITDFKNYLATLDYNALVKAQAVQNK